MPPIPIMTSVLFLPMWTMITLVLSPEDRWHDQLTQALTNAQPPLHSVAVIFLRGTPPGVTLTLTAVSARRAHEDLTLKCLQEDASEFETLGVAGRRSKADPVWLKILKEKWGCDAVAFIDASTHDQVTTLTTFLVPCDSGRATTRFVSGPFSIEVPPPSPSPSPSLATSLPAPVALTIRTVVFHAADLTLDPLSPSPVNDLLRQAAYPPFVTTIEHGPTLSLDAGLAPGLAMSWESPDGITWTFTLASGIAAPDLLAGWERLIRIHSPHAWPFLGVDGLDAFLADTDPHLAGLSSKGRDRLVITLTQPDWRFPLRLCGPGWGLHAPSAFTPIERSPKKLALQDRDRRVLESHLLPNLEAALIEFELGRLDYCEPPASSVAEVRDRLGRNASRLAPLAASDAIILGVPFRRPPFHLADVQRGLFNVLNRQALLLGPFHQQAVLPSQGETTSPTRAHLLLADTSLPPLRLLFPEGDRDLAVIADQLVADGKIAGLIIHPRALPPALWLEAARKEEGELILFRFRPTTLHPLEMPLALLHSQSQKLGANVFGFADPWVDAQLDAALDTRDPDRLTQTLVRTTSRIWSKAPCTILFHLARSALVNPSAPLESFPRGYRVSPPTPRP